MEKMVTQEKEKDDVIVTFPHPIRYKRNGVWVDKDVTVSYRIPKSIAQEGEIDNLVLSEEMITVIYEAEREMKRAQKRASEWKIGSYVEGLSEIAI